MSFHLPHVSNLDRIRASGLVCDVESHEEIGSTNDRAAELAASSDVDCPFLIVAARQTAGRGRGTNQWWSPGGALTFSLLLDENQIGLPRARWPQIALAAGVAVCEAIVKMLPDAMVRLKWPNDVFIAGKKVSGILVEAPAVSTARLIVGIGVNVNNTFTDAPPELRQTATSLFDVAGQPVDPTALLIALLERFEVCRASLAEDSDALFARWRRRCLLTGKRVELNAGSRNVTGLCRGIDDFGRLLLTTDQGTESHQSGTVVSFE